MKEREPVYASRWAAWLTLGVALALCVRISSVWAALPETMASHFGLSGEPDAFMSKTGFFVFMALIGGGTIALLFAMPWFLRRLPARWINLPNREYWLANDARRVEGLRRLSWFLEWIAFATAALLAVATELALRANLSRTAFENGPFLVFLGLYFVFVVGALIQQFRTLAVPGRP
jgi:uncharacterized membrane protein